MSQFWSQSSHPSAEEARAGATPHQIEKLVSFTKGYDAIQNIENGSSAKFFFQFGMNDDWTNEEECQRLYERCSSQKRLLWYEDNHDMMSEPVRKDYLRWLFQELDL